LVISLGLALIGVGGLTVSIAAIMGVWNPAQPENATPHAELSTPATVVEQPLRELSGDVPTTGSDIDERSALARLERELLDRDLELADYRALVAKLQQQAEQQRELYDQQREGQRRELDRLNEQMQTATGSANVARAANSLLKEQLATNRRLLQDQKEVSARLRDEIARTEDRNRQLEQQLDEATVVARPRTIPQSGDTTAIRPSADYDDRGWRTANP
jgi:chromosome segregation ATPase